MSRLLAAIPRLVGFLADRQAYCVEDFKKLPRMPQDATPVTDQSLVVGRSGWMSCCRCGKKMVPNATFETQQAAAC